MTAFLYHISHSIFFMFSYDKIQIKYFYYKVKKKITFFHYFVSFILKPFHYKLTGLTYDNFSFFITHYSLYFLYIYHNLKAKHHPHNVKHKITFFNKFLQILGYNFATYIITIYQLCIISLSYKMIEKLFPKQRYKYILVIPFIFLAFLHPILLFFSSVLHLILLYLSCIQFLNNMQNGMQW